MGDAGLYMSIMSGTLLLISMFTCFKKVFKLSKEGKTEVPLDSDPIVKLKSTVYYCFGFSLTFWLAPLDIVLSSILGMIMGAATSVLLSMLCPKICKKVLDTLNNKRQNAESRASQP